MVDGRRKGLRFENTCARLMSFWASTAEVCADDWQAWPLDGLPFRRRSTSIMPLEGHWRGKGDLLYRPGIRCPFSIECKLVEGWGLDSFFEGTSVVWTWWKQCRQQAASSGLRPLLLLSRNRKPVYVLLEDEVLGCLHTQRLFPFPVLRTPGPGPGERLALLRMLDLVKATPWRRVEALAPRDARKSAVNSSSEPSEGPLPF
jgi:hypothetical protein